MIRSGKRVTNSISLSTRIPNKKQRVRTSINEITNQYFRKLLKEFLNSLYLGYKNNRFIMNQLKVTFS